MLAKIDEKIKVEINWTEETAHSNFLEMSKSDYEEYDKNFADLPRKALQDLIEKYRPSNSNEIDWDIQTDTIEIYPLDKDGNKI